MAKPASRGAIAGRAALFAAFLWFAPAPAGADVVLVPDPDKWIETQLKNLTEGQTDEFANQFVKLIDKESSLESLAASIRPIAQMGKPAFLEKVSDLKYGSALREVVYLALFRRTDYLYFKFIMKKNTNGWLITNFEFKNETSALFPKGFIGPQ
jgi:hypothetical protein